MQYKLRTTVALTFADLPPNVNSFLCSNGLWPEWQKWFVWRGRCREWRHNGPPSKCIKKAL